MTERDELDSVEPQSILDPRMFERGHRVMDSNASPDLLVRIGKAAKRIAGVIFDPNSSVSEQTEETTGPDR